MDDKTMRNLVNGRLGGRTSRRRFAQGIGAGLAASALGTSRVATGSAGAQDQPFAGQQLVLTSYGGTWEEFMRANILPPFQEQTGAEVELAVGLSAEWVAQLRAAGLDNPPFDVVIANETYISTARLEGNFVALPEEKVPNLANVHPQLRMPDDIGVLGLIGPLGLAYRTDLVETPPTGWEDLANFESIGIYNVVNSACAQHIMMMAKILTGDPKNWEAGFDWIREELCPFKQTDFSGDMESLLIQGEINVGILDSPAWARLSQQDVPIGWVAPEEGLFMFEQNMNVTGGSEVQDLGFAFIDYMLSAPVQLLWAEEYYWTPANTTVTVGEELQELIPILADDIDRIEKWDWEWLNSGPRDEMVNRWNREIAGGC